MAILNILTAPDPNLKKTATPVDKVDASIRKIRDDLFDTLYSKEALGLAGVQVNIHKRLIAIDLSKYGYADIGPLFLANPEILKVSSETQITDEACLSVPGFSGKITRPLEIEVAYLDENNQKQVLKTSGLLADCIQHEIDHLNGILFIDHLSSIKRKIILDKLRRWKIRKG